MPYLHATTLSISIQFYQIDHEPFSHYNCNQGHIKQGHIKIAIIVRRPNKGIRKKQPSRTSIITTNQSIPNGSSELPPLRPPRRFDFLVFFLLGGSGAGGSGSSITSIVCPRSRSSNELLVPALSLPPQKFRAPPRLRRCGLRLSPSELLSSITSTKSGPPSPPPRPHPRSSRTSAMSPWLSRTTAVRRRCGYMKEK